LLGGGATDATGTGGNVVLAEGSGTTAANYGTIQIGSAGSKTRGFVSGSITVAAAYFSSSTALTTGECSAEDKTLAAGDVPEWTAAAMRANDNVVVVARMTALGVTISAEVKTPATRIVEFTICNFGTASATPDALVGTMGLFVSLAAA